MQAVAVILRVGENKRFSVIIGRRNERYFDLPFSPGARTSDRAVSFAPSGENEQS